MRPLQTLSNLLAALREEDFSFKARGTRGDDALSHALLEVNALASPMGLESGPKGEAYPMFYTYCPALDQFVSSSLNEGAYPAWYLSANLGRPPTL